MTGLSAYDPAVMRVVGLLLGLAAGVVLGLAHFGALRLTVRYFADGRALRAAAFQLLRFALVGAGFLGLAQLGAGPLIAGLVGLLLARRAALRRIGGAP